MITEDMKTIFFIISFVLAMFGISRILVDPIKERIRDLENKVYELNRLTAMLEGMYKQETGNINPFKLSEEYRGDTNANTTRKNKKG